MANSQRDKGKSKSNNNKPAPKNDPPSANSHSPPTKKPKLRMTYNTTPLKQGMRFERGETSRRRVKRGSRSLKFTNSSEENSAFFENMSHRIQSNAENFKAKMDEIDRTFGRILASITSSLDGKYRSLSQTQVIREAEYCGRHINPLDDEDWVRINVYGGGLQDRGMTFSVHRLGDLGLVFREYAFHLNAEVDDIIMTTESGRRITPSSMPFMVGINTGDRLTVHHRTVSTFNCDTNKKRFKIRTVNKEPLEMSMTVPLDEPILEVYEQWSAFSKLPIGTFTLWNEMCELTTDGTIESFGILNEAEVFCVPTQEKPEEDASEGDEVQQDDSDEA